MMSHFFIVNVEAAILKNGKYLIIKRSEKEGHAGGLYSLVGGKIEFNEGSLNVLEENLQREVFEEIGIQVKSLNYVHSNTFMVGETQVLNVVFLSLDHVGEPYLKSPDEVADIKWITYKEIQESDEIPDWTKNSIRLSEESIHTII